MTRGNNITQLKETVDYRARRQIPTQVFWGIVKKVDWEEKTCTVDGLTDELPFYEVSLGLKDRIIKPKVGAKCLIGAIGNIETSPYLIDAEEMEEVVLKVGKTRFKMNLKEMLLNGDDYDGLVRVKKLEDNLNQLKTYCEQLKEAVSNGLNAVGVGSSANGGTGKATFEGAMNGQQIDFKDMENKKIKHGSH